ncbi:SelL-related redox protein [Leptospira fainei]|uniref:SelL-related redox protein n=1 Tax=Leptospira fainei TaxID=48782 RepID=UPI0002F42702|nr:SelL-related redox protein [Leptospira fainei]
MKFLPKEFLSHPVEGRRLVGTVLGENLPAKPSLLIFLRHLGCIFCRETVADLRLMAESMPAFPPVLFIYPDMARDGEEFFQRFWPEASAIADPKTILFRLAELHDGGFLELAGPEVWVSALRAVTKGNFYGVQGQHLLQMPGAFLVLKDRILWKHTYRHIGDHPDWTKLPGCTPIPSEDFDPGILPA